MIPQQIQIRTGIARRSIDQVLSLLDEGATIPFIARYRKEKTGSLDEVQISQIKSEYDQLQILQKRKKTIISAIEDQRKLTQQLKDQISNTWDSSILEDLYLPYKKSRKKPLNVNMLMTNIHAKSNVRTIAGVRFFLPFATVMTA